jgi:hypothetical protein
LEKFLEITGIRLSSEVSDLVGASLRATLTPVIDGKHDRAVLAWLAEGTWDEKSRHRPEALAGRFIEHHAPARMHLERIDSITS